MMELLSEAEGRQLAERVARMNTGTTAQVVVMLEAQADSDHWPAWGWAGVAALGMGPLLTLVYPEAPWLIQAVQWGVFLGGGCVLRQVGGGHWMLSAAHRHWRASNLARRRFFEQGLHHVPGQQGLLLWVGEAERYVEILADQGIACQVDDLAWEKIVQQMQALLGDGLGMQALETGLGALQQILGEALPSTKDNPARPLARLVIRP